MSNQYVFNQYYIDFIKRLKQAAKKMKEDNNEDNEGDSKVSDDNYLFAKTIIKTIKANYTTFDKSSDEYIKYINSLPENFWTSYADAEESKIDEWFDTEEVKGVEIFTNISVKQIQRLINDNFLCHHFLTVFYLFKNDLSDEEVKKYIKIFQESSEELLNEIENEGNKKIIARINSLKSKNIKDKTNINMAGMEDTMLGKLAKEILEDVDIDKLQKSIGENGDILKAIGDPNSGFSDLISNVSRKMATKMSNGELKQENLLQDAMKFASIMPGMFGNQNGGPGGPGGPSGAGAAGGPSGAGGSGPDMAAMMKMMGAMMNNKEGMEAFGNMMNPKGKKKDTRTTFNKNAYRKSMAINRLRTKLDRKEKDGE
jgi:hypothetical protein